MKYFNICTRKTYQSNGKEKTVWLKCGTMRENEEGNMFIELNHLPNISFYVFDQKKQESGEEL